MHFDIREYEATHEAALLLEHDIREEKHLQGGALLAHDPADGYIFVPLAPHVQLSDHGEAAGPRHCLQLRPDT